MGQFWSNRTQFNMSGKFNWIHQKNKARENDNKNRKIREVLEITKAKCNKKIKALEMKATLLKLTPGHRQYKLNVNVLGN